MLYQLLLITILSNFILGQNQSDKQQLINQLPNIVNDVSQNYQFLIQKSDQQQEYNNVQIGSNTNQDALLKFVSGSDRAVHFGLQYDTGSFVIKNQQSDLIQSNEKGQLIIGGKSLNTQSIQLKKEAQYQWQSYPQWRLLYNEDFSNQDVTANSGWTKTSITTCGGIQMLGGYGKFAKGEVFKKFTKLPQHTLIRIQALYHFIDAWKGENGYMKLNIGRENRLEYVWTQKHDYTKYKEGSNVCGDSKIPENQLSSQINVVVPHNSDNLQILFGSTLDDDAFANSWGISSLEVFIK